MSFDDPFANVEPQKPKKQPVRGRKKDKFDQPLDVSRRDAYKATGTGGSAMHGEYYQLTTRLPVEIVEQVREWAAELKMTQQDLQRYPAHWSTNASYRFTNIPAVAPQIRCCSYCST